MLPGSVSSIAGRQFAAQIVNVEPGKEIYESVSAVHEVRGPCQSIAFNDDLSFAAADFLQDHVDRVESFSVSDGNACHLTWNDFHDDLAFVEVFDCSSGSSDASVANVRRCLRGVDIKENHSLFRNVNSIRTLVGPSNPEPVAMLVPAIFRNFRIDTFVAHVTPVKCFSHFQRLPFEDTAKAYMTMIPHAACTKNIAAAEGSGNLATYKLAVRN